MLVRRGGGKRHPAIQAQNQSSSQKRNSAPSPSCGLQKGRMSGKAPRSPVIKGESPRREFAHTLYSRECPYASRRSIDTMSMNGSITQITHLLNSVMLVCSRCRMPRPPCATGRHTVVQATRATPPRDLCPAPEKTPHGSLKSTSHPRRHAKDRHEIGWDCREDCLYQN